MNSLLCLLFLLKNVNSFVNFKFGIPSSKFENDSHLKLEHIKRLCENKETVCKSKDSNVCAVRLINKTFEYKDFNNSCYLFMTNMCELPGHEFSIANAGSCGQDQTRRLILPEQKPTTKFMKINVTAKPILRKTEEPSTLYEIDTAFDYHTCPLSCPDVYSPVCVGVNRGFGLYYKFYTFINHCAADIYYCKNWREFSPPPDENEMVRSSPLSWSYCAANRPTHIMKPNENPF